jgi:exodeoxyribonuclease V gamma subunit
LTLTSHSALPAEAVEEVDLQKVVHFWRHPLRSYLQNTLSIYLDRDDTLDVPDREPLELGWLENRTLVSTLIEARSQGLDAAAAQTALEARGQLPLGGAGAVVFSNLEQLASKMMATARDTIGWDPTTHQDVGIDVDVGGIRLVGHVPGVCRGGLVRFFYGTKRESDLLEVWAELLALRAQVPAHPARALLVYATVKDDGEVTLKPIGLDATQLDDRGLADLHHRLTLSQSGLHQPLPFFPKTSHAIAKALRQKKNGLPAEWQHPSRLANDDLSPVAGVLSKARTDADSKWLSGFSKGEGDDRYYRHAFGDQRPYLTPEGDLSRAVLTLAARCWWPVITGERTRAKIKGWVPA